MPSPWPPPSLEYSILISLNLVYISIYLSIIYLSIYWLSIPSWPSILSCSSIYSKNQPIKRRANILISERKRKGMSFEIVLDSRKLDNIVVFKVPFGTDLYTLWHRCAAVQIIKQLEVGRQIHLGRENDRYACKNDRY